MSKRLMFLTMSLLLAAGLPAMEMIPMRDAPVARTESGIFWVKLQSVDFLGAGNHLIGKQDQGDWTDDTFEDDATVRINYAEWQDNTLDGRPEIHDPVCYTKSSLPQMTAVICSTRLPYVVPAKLKVLNGDNILLTRDINLNGRVTVPNLIWNTALPATLRNQDYTLTWQVSLDGGNNYMDIGTSVNRFFVVLAHPITPGSTGKFNAPSCRRLDKILKVAIGMDETADIDLIAERIQVWRDGAAGIDTSGNFGGVQSLPGSMYWGLLDAGRNPRLKGQCGEGSVLMDLAIKLIGIDSSKYEHIYASTSFPVDTIGPPKKRDHSDSSCGAPFEMLLLWFASDGDFGGGNAGEGCCLVNSVLYDAFAGSHTGKTGEFVNGDIAVSPEHSILLQLDESYPRVQRWMKTQQVQCSTDWYVPVPRN